MMRKIILSLLSACSIHFAVAGVTIDGTRIVFPASSSNVGVQIRNEFNTPALVQTWIDDGDLSEIPEAEKIPFVISPPLSRVEPNQGQIIRIIQTGSPKLPEDRETLFWFNMLDIPPDNQNLANKNLLSFTVRTRIKLFYRPSKLKMADEGTYSQVQFKISEVNGGLEVKNPTPYFITFVNIVASDDFNEKNITRAIMVNPFSSQIINEIKLPKSLNKVDYSVLNDLGGVQKFTKTLN